MKPSFWQVARRPKWIAGLVLAAIVAVVFAGLMQWQLDRTFNVVGVSIEDREPVPLDTLAKPAELQPFAFDRLVTAQVQIDAGNAYVVSDRLQLVDGESVRGYWVVVNSYVDGASLTLAIGFTEDLELAKEVATNLRAETAEVLGYIQPTEAVKPRSDGILGSVVLGELVNLYFREPTPSYPIYLILQSGVETELDQISIEIRQQEIEINWLTAFYAAEWAFFALAAFYVWWRMIQDARIREAEASLAATEEPQS
jgi:surfeit locus 1 family protein